MARSIDPACYEIDFYYCTERAEQAYFLDELFELSDRDLRLRIIPIRTVSLGRIGADDIRGASRDLEQKDILICGPPVMIENLTTQLVAAGVPRGQIHFENFDFMSCG